MQAGRKGRDQGLSLAGAHLRDATLVQHDAAEQLDVEMPHAQCPARRLAHQREDLRQQGVHRLPLGEASPALVGAFAQLCVVRVLQCGFHLVDLQHRPPVTLEEPLVAAAEKSADECVKHAGNRR